MWKVGADIGRLLLGLGDCAFSPLGDRAINALHVSKEEGGGKPPPASLHLPGYDQWNPMLIMP
jgi:hypothetical protein